MDKFKSRQILRNADPDTVIDDVVVYELDFLEIAEAIRRISLEPTMEAIFKRFEGMTIAEFLELYKDVTICDVIGEQMLDGYILEGKLFTHTVKYDYHLRLLAREDGYTTLDEAYDDQYYFWTTFYEESILPQSETDDTRK